MADVFDLLTVVGVIAIFVFIFGRPYDKSNYKPEEWVNTEKRLKNGPDVSSSNDIDSDSIYRTGGGPLDPVNRVHLANVWKSLLDDN